MSFTKWLSKLPLFGFPEKRKDLSEQRPEVLRVRARDKRGRFVADDPSTPENEAYRSSK